MQQSIYLPDEKKELLERALELSDQDSLSATIVEAVEEYVEHKSTLAKDMKKHTLRVPVWDYVETDVQGKTVKQVETKTVKFMGKLLNHKVAIKDEEARIPSSNEIKLYQGKKGKYLLYWNFKKEKEAGYTTAESLEELENQKETPELPEGFLAEARQKLKELEESESVAEIIDI